MADPDEGSLPLIDRVRRGLGERYAVEREIGRGGMAVVFLAEDRKHHRRVAVKVLKPELVPALGTERFLREIETVARLTHPNILPLFDSGDLAAERAGEPPLLYYVMPYVEGETLRQRLSREKQLPLEESLQIAQQVVAALGFAHSRGLIHRDIKPENILFQAGQAVVSDFGIARAVSQAGGDALTESGMAVGTLAYMSPEQAAGRKDLDARSDLYSLGVVLYEMLAGETPLASSTGADPTQGPAADLRRARETVSLPVAGVVAQALARLPGDRFATASQLSEALHRSAASAERSAAARRRIPARTVGSVLAIAAVAAVGWYLAAGRRTSADPRRIVVAPFEDRTGDSSLGQLGDLAADWVTRGLSRSQSFDVIPATMARDAWRDLPADPADRVRGLAERTRAGVVISGAYSTENGSVQFEAELMDPRNGRLITSIDPVRGPARDPSAVVATLADRVAAAAVARLDPQGRTLPSGPFNPPSLEAFREYQEGMDLFSRGQWQQAITHFSLAGAVDSTYLPPRVWAVPAYMNLGRWGTADTMVMAIRPMLGRLTPTEQATLEWYAASIHDDREAALRWTEELFRLDPERGAYPLATIAVRDNRPGRALEVLRHYDRDTPFAKNWTPYWRVYGTAYHLVGDYRSELKVARRWRDQYPEDLAGLSLEAQALAALGQVGEVEQALAQVPSLRPGREGAARVSSHAQTPLVVAQELLAHGYREPALAILERLIREIRSGTVDDADPYTLARALYLAGHWAEAGAVFDSLHRGQPRNVDYLGSLGAVYARLGDRGRAMAVDSILAADRNPYRRSLPVRWQAQIAAVLGDRERAVRLLRQAHVIALDLHQELDFALLRDYPPFQEFSKPR